MRNPAHSAEPETEINICEQAQITSPIQKNSSKCKRHIRSTYLANLTVICNPFVIMNSFFANDPLLIVKQIQSHPEWTHHHSQPPEGMFGVENCPETELQLFKSSFRRWRRGKRRLALHHQRKLLGLLSCLGNGLCSRFENPTFGHWQ